MTEPYLGRSEEEVVKRAKLFVDGFLENGEEAGGSGKDTAAAISQLRNQVSKRHDPMSRAILVELDARTCSP